MKSKQTTKLWVFVAVLAVCLVACGKNDEPEQRPNPDTEQEDPNTEQDDPNTDQGDQDSDPVENWEDEKPHGFYFDLDSIALPLNEDGFLLVEVNNKICDAVVMEERFKRPKTGAILYGCTGTRSFFEVVGKKANPWVNVDKYIEMCQTIHLRPDSKFSNFPELEGLPLGNVQMFGTMTVDTLVNVDVISHKYFCADIPAGGSMRGREDLYGDRYVVYAFLEFIEGAEIFKEMQRGPYVVGGPGPSGSARMGKCNIRYIMSNMTLWITGYPDEPGVYPMTMRMEFANGKVLTRDFKIRYVDEEK